MIRFDGQKFPARRRAIEQSPTLDRMVLLGELGDRVGTASDLRMFYEFRKTTTIYATRIMEDFEVETLEGLHTGKAGDYLAVGVHGEMYPIDGDVFKASYEEVPRASS